jgi:hypothetical protein
VLAVPVQVSVFINMFVTCVFAAGFYGKALQVRKTAVQQLVSQDQIFLHCQPVTIVINSGQQMLLCQGPAGAQDSAAAYDPLELSASINLKDNLVVTSRICCYVKASQMRNTLHVCIESQTIVNSAQWRMDESTPALVDM